MATTALTVPQKINDFELSLMREKSLGIFLEKPEAISRFVKSVRLAMMIDPLLASADKQSLVLSCLKAAQFKWQIGTDAHLVRFRNNKTGVDDVTLIPDYRGIQKTFRRCAQIEISARNVYENDDFEINYGTNESIVHQPCINGDKGKAIGAYAVAHFPNGRTKFYFCDLDELALAEAKSKSGIWKSSPAAMQRKTAVKRLGNYLPLEHEEIEHLIRYENALDRAEEDGDNTAVDAEYTELTDASVTPQTQADKINKILTPDEETDFTDEDLRKAGEAALQPETKDGQLFDKGGEV